MHVSLATIDRLDELADLFDRYRIFYGQPSNRTAAQTFLRERLENGDSILFVAHKDEALVGFTQLYPSFSSVAMRRIWILNDLYVDESFRRARIATLLMDAAEDYARQTNAIRVALATQIMNAQAQRLYESRGYIRDEIFYHYSLSL